jgi:TolB protein
MRQISKIPLILATLLCSFSLVGAGLKPVPMKQGRIETGTNRGAEEVRLAFPAFQPKTTDANTVKLTNLFNQVVWDDLDYAGNIALVSRSFYPLGKFMSPTDIKVEDWTKQGVNAQYLAFGSTQIANGVFRIEERLWDLAVVENRELIADGALPSPNEDSVRVAAHMFADKIVDKLFGGRIGIAQTKIAYVAATGGNNKEIYVMDYDGANAFPLTSYRSTSIMPNWSPDGNKVAFITYRKGFPEIEIMSVLDRKLYDFPPFNASTETPAWSPDGSQIAYATIADKNMELFVADWNGKNAKRLTVNKSIDISPSWNPKNPQKIAFVSDRSGSQQIYMMDSDGTNVERLITEGGDAENPSWSADGQFIAFAWKKPATHYDIYIHNLATGRNSQLTSDQGDNERPSWAPDGRHIVFTSNRNGRSQIYSILANGQKLRQLTRNGSNEGPAWSSFIGK